MEIVIMITQLILGLSLLVGLHELGHYLAARAFGMRVEQFFIGFPPKLLKIKIGHTEYGIGSIPLGGYVKIAGMIDESLDVEMLNKPPQPYEFRSKPAWQRLIVMIGGVSVNLITGVMIFIGLTFILGDKYLSTKDAKFGIIAYPMAQEIGLKTGDKILNISGKNFERFNDVLSPDVLLNNGGYYTVERNNQELKINIPSNLIDKMSVKKNQTGFIEPITPFKVGKIIAGSPAEKAGLKEGDQITRIDNDNIRFFHELQNALLVKKGKAVALAVTRNNQNLLLNAKVTAEGKIGFQVEPLLKYSTERYTFFQSIFLGSEKAFSIVGVQFKAFGKMFSGEIDPKNALSGPIGIAREFGGNWDWVRFWNLCGLLSMVLAFMNLLPIPALDGGHVLFLSFEMISGRKPSDKFLEISQKAGMAILFSLMILAVFNDILKLF
jgi:regulator of sigma E protease